MPVTIRDVARAAGVHISTVSRSFSAPHLVNAQTRTRVLTSAESLGYRPNHAARALITGRTYNIGLIVADIANPFFPPLIKAAQNQARRRDYSVFIADTDEDRGVEERLVRAVARQVDGIVLCSPRMANERIDRLRVEAPIVVINRAVPSLPAVLMDMAAGAAQAVEHLLQLGHRKIALLDGPRGSWAGRQIRRSAQVTAQAGGANLGVIGPSPPTEAGGAEAAQVLLHSGATAVLAYNDLMAIGLLVTLERLAVRVPQDISVIGIDDIALSRLTRPGLTTVATPAAAAGETAVDMLLSSYGGPPPANQVTLATQLIIRDSTGPVPAR